MRFLRFASIHTSWEGRFNGYLPYQAALCQAISPLPEPVNPMVKE